MIETTDCIVAAWRADEVTLREAERLIAFVALRERGVPKAAWPPPTWHRRTALLRRLGLPTTEGP